MAGPSSMGGEGALGRQRAGILVAASLLLLVGLGWTDVSAPDEPRYLQVAEEMRSLPNGPSGLVLLHLNGEPYTQKPPLYYGLAALLGTPSGRVTEVTGRLPSALAGIATVALTIGLGVRLFGPSTGLLGALLLLTTFEFANLARRIHLDVLLAFFETLALVVFWAGDRGRLRVGAAALLFHLALGLAVLTKGPVGFLIPALAVLGFLAWDGRLREARRWFPVAGLALSILPGVAWIAGAIALAPEGFADEAVTTNLIGRFFSGTSHERPFYYYLYQFPVDLLPWTLLLPAVFWAGRRRVFVVDSDPEQRRAWRFLISWVLASLIFFSLSSGKRGLYMVPAFPAVALLCADSVRLWVARHGRIPRGLALPLLVFGGLLAGVGALALVVGVAGTALPGSLPDFARAVHRPLLTGFGLVVIGVVVAAVWGFRRAERSGGAPLRPFLVAVAAAFAIEAGVFALLLPALDPIRSPRPIAEAAAAITPPGKPIGLYRESPMIGGIVYYGGRPVAHLLTPEDVTDFVADGGDAIVVKSRKFERLGAIAPVESVARIRPGRRAIVVTRPSGPAATPGEPGD